MDQINYGQEGQISIKVSSNVQFTETFIVGQFLNGILTLKCL